jgi:hypothetical protein
MDVRGDSSNELDPIASTPPSPAGFARLHADAYSPAVLNEIERHLSNAAPLRVQMNMPIIAAACADRTVDTLQSKRLAGSQSGAPLKRVAVPSKPIALRGGGARTADDGCHGRQGQHQGY